MLWRGRHPGPRLTPGASRQTDPCGGTRQAVIHREAPTFTSVHVVGYDWAGGFAVAIVEQTPRPAGAVDEQALIDRWLERNPHKPWLDEVRVVDRGVAVWALIGHLGGTAWDVDRTARAHRLPRGAVEAACAFYRRHGALIDARLQANTADVAAPL